MMIAARMISLTLLSPSEMCRELANRAREARLSANLTQEGLAERSGVSLGSLKRFERMGAISLESLVRIGITLKHEGDFEGLFKPPRFTSMDQVMSAPEHRRRGRIK